MDFETPLRWAEEDVIVEETGHKFKWSRNRYYVTFDMRDLEVATVVGKRDTPDCDARPVFDHWLTISGAASTGGRTDLFATFDRERDRATLVNLRRVKDPAKIILTSRVYRLGMVHQGRYQRVDETWHQGSYQLVDEEGRLVIEVFVPEGSLLSIAEGVHRGHVLRIDLTVRMSAFQHEVDAFVNDRWAREFLIENFDRCALERVAARQHEGQPASFTISYTDHSEEDLAEAYPEAAPTFVVAPAPPAATDSAMLKVFSGIRTALWTLAIIAAFALFRWLDK